LQPLRKRGVQQTLKLQKSIKNNFEKSFKKVWKFKSKVRYLQPLQKRSAEKMKTTKMITTKQF
jgi:hypothetical protein